MHPVATYLKRLSLIHQSGQGTAETSSYAALEELLREVGNGLKPQVIPVSQLKNSGAGMPDFGLFTKEQIKKKGFSPDLVSAIMPARGVVEVKGTSDKTWLTAKGAQATKYWEKYRLVLITNYRDFYILGQDSEGKPLPLGTYSISKDEAEFWASAHQAENTAILQGEAFLDFLRRAMLQAAPLREPEDLAALLAVYAREARHPLMRQAFLHHFDRIWIDSLNGDKYATGKLTPTGESDPSIFSTPQNREGIQVGTAVALMVRKVKHKAAGEVAYRDLWGKDKLAKLNTEADGPAPTYPAQVTPHPKLGLPFRPLAVSKTYLAWPTLEEVFPISFPGVKTSRDSFLVDIDLDRLESRLAQYFDPTLSHSSFKEHHPEIMTPGSRFQPEAVRDTLRKRGITKDGLVRYAYRPLDVRWLYWEGETKLLDEKRPDYRPQVFVGNVYLVSQQVPRREWAPPQITSSLGCLDLMDRGASLIPMLIRAHHEDGALYTADERPNLSPKALEKMTALGAEPTDLFFHALAILHAPAYREENAGALRMDWPRLPWPANLDALNSSMVIGRRVAALLDVEQSVPMVTAGKIAPTMKPIGTLHTTDGAPLDLAGDLEVTAGWAIRGQGGVAMPSEGKREGDRVYLNDHTYWGGISDEVWNYSLGGYQVLKKWLSYRESKLLGRSLSIEEANHFTDMTRRISALLEMGDELNRNYSANL